MSSIKFGFLQSIRYVKDMPSRTPGPTGTRRWGSRSWKLPHGPLTEKRLQSRLEIIQTQPSTLPRLEEPFVARIRINNVEARCLIDTGASGDFVSSHFTFVNRLKHRKLDSAIPIQQAVKGSKPKCNAIATATVQFGDWAKKISLYVIHLANYDAIIGLPTLMDAGARFDLPSNTLHLQEYGVSLPLERFQPVARPQRKVPASHAPAGTPPDSGTDLSVASATVIDESAPIPATPPVFSVYPDVDKHGTADYYRNLIYEHYADVFVDKLPAQLPPLRVVNHRIPVKIEKPWMAPLLPPSGTSQEDAWKRISNSNYVRALLCPPQSFRWQPRL